MVVAQPVGPKHFSSFPSPLLSSPLRQCQMAVGCRRKGIDALTFLDRKTPLFGEIFSFSQKKTGDRQILCYLLKLLRRKLLCCL